MSNAGDLDLTFGINGLVITDFSNSSNDLAYSVVIDNNNKIVVAGYTDVNEVNVTNDFALARYDNSGNLDLSFGINGLVTTDFSNNTDDFGWSVVIDNNNKIVVAGYTYDYININTNFALARYDNSGILDLSFGINGLVITDFSNNTSDDQAYSLVIDNNNKIVVAGYTWDYVNDNTDFALARYDNSGNLDTTFGINGLVITDFSNNSNDESYSVVIDNNNKIVVAGRTYNNDGIRHFALARYDNLGILDTTFGPDGNGKVITDFSNNTTDDRAYSVVIDNNNNKIVVAGYIEYTNGKIDFALARYDNSGNLDSSFGINGKVITDFSSNTSDDYAISVVIDYSNNKIVVAGYIEDTNGNVDFALARYDNSGNLDTTFGINGLVITNFPNNINDYAESVVIDNNNKIVLAGRSRGNDGSRAFALARYLSEDIPPSPSPPISNICFTANTPIRTDQGIIAIEKINPDRHTIRNKKIIAITQTITVDKYLVCFEKNAIGKNIPSEKTIVSKNHLIFNKGEMITANDFITKYENVYKVKYKGEILYNVLLEHHDKMVVNNLICETLDPENMIAKLYTLLPNYNLQEQSQIIKKYNHIVNKKFKLLAQKKN
jgi:uncharacterized delta-60 repeat protein